MATHTESLWDIIPNATEKKLSLLPNAWILESICIDDFSKFQINGEIREDKVKFLEEYPALKEGTRLLFIYKSEIKDYFVFIFHRYDKTGWKIFQKRFKIDIYGEMNLFSRERDAIVEDECCSRTIGKLTSTYFVYSEFYKEKEYEFCYRVWPLVDEPKVQEHKCPNLNLGCDLDSLELYLDYLQDQNDW